MTARVLWAIPVLAVTVAFLLLVVLRNPVWTTDGFSYARMTLEDAGLGSTQALKIAEAFYQRTPVGRDPRYLGYFTVDAKHAPPAAGPIFRSRVLDPWVASLLYPRRGLLALLDVSAGAFLMGTLALYLLLLALVRPWLAAIGAMAFAVSPLVISLAESALTDMLALALWIVALGALFYYLQQRRSIWAFVFALTCIALALTRPMLYLPAGAAAGALLSARIRRDRADTLDSLTLASILVTVWIGNFIREKLLHSAGLQYELEVSHKLAIRSGSASSHESASIWYRRSVFRNVVHEIEHGIRLVLPVLAVVVMVVEIKRKEVAVLLGAALAGLVPLLIDPMVYDLPRVLEAPLYPVILLALAIGAERLLASRPAIGGEGPERGRS